jgi:hypothetical protein
MENPITPVPVLAGTRRSSAGPQPLDGRRLGPPGPRSVAGPLSGFPSFRSLLAGLAAAFLLLGCGAREAATPIAPADARDEAREVAEVSALDGAYTLFFDWSASEPGLRVRGQGVARVEPPFRARLDLFTSRGERIAVAALVEDDLRVPAGTPDILPPGALLWGALGVFRPGSEAGLDTGARRGNEATELRYRLPGDEELLYLIRDFRVHGMEVRSRGRTLEELRLVREGDDRFPREAVYRDLVRVRELRITLERVENASSFSSDIWSPGR